eukprot:scaffold269667_cov35-Tisochrysis_lutea.AAC.3
MPRGPSATAIGTKSRCCTLRMCLKAHAGSLCTSKIFVLCTQNSGGSNCGSVWPTPGMMVLVNRWCSWCSSRHHLELTPKPQQPKNQPSGWSMARLWKTWLCMKSCMRKPDCCHTPASPMKPATKQRWATTGESSP